MSNNFKLVNLWQSTEERRGKYWLAKSLGASSSHAQRMRDWRLAKIERLYGLEITDKNTPELDRLLYQSQTL